MLLELLPLSGFNALFEHVGAGECGPLRDQWLLVVNHNEVMQAVRLVALFLVSPLNRLLIRYEQPWHLFHVLVLEIPDEAHDLLVFALEVEDDDVEHLFVASFDSVIIPLQELFLADLLDVDALDLLQGHRSDRLRRRMLVHVV